jgi:hypothetical protein
MELVETTIAGEIVRLRLANDAARDVATEWLDIAVRTTPDRAQPLTALQADALQHARNVINDALRQIEDHLNLNPPLPPKAEKREPSNEKPIRGFSSTAPVTRAASLAASVDQCL